MQNEMLRDGSTFHGEWAEKEVSREITLRAETQRKPFRREGKGGQGGEGPGDSKGRGVNYKARRD